MFWCAECEDFWPTKFFSLSQKAKSIANRKCENCAKHVYEFQLSEEFRKSLTLWCCVCEDLVSTSNFLTTQQQEKNAEERKCKKCSNENEKTHNDINNISCEVCETVITLDNMSKGMQTNCEQETPK